MTDRAEFQVTTIDRVQYSTGKVLEIRAIAVDGRPLTAQITTEYIVADGSLHTFNTNVPWRFLERVIRGLEEVQRREHERARASGIDVRPSPAWRPPKRTGP